MALSGSAALAGDNKTADSSAAKKSEEKADAKSDSKSEASTPASTKLRLARILLKSDLPEATGAPSLFSEIRSQLREVIDRLDRAAKDEKLSGVILAVRSPAVGLGKVGEFRGAIARVRAAGKKIYAELPSGENKEYLIAAACDEVAMPPSGALVINGLHAELTYYKGLLDKLGVQADFIQIGAFKGAAEPLTRSQMSDEFRQQFSAVIDDYYQQEIRTIAKDRHLKAKKVQKLIDEGLFTAEQAKEAGLIDRVCYEDELIEQLKKEAGATEVVVDREYGKKKVDTDFSGLTGFLKLLEIMMGVEHTVQGTKSSSKVAVVYAVGPIMDGESTSSLLGEETLGGDTLVKALRKAKKDSTVKAIVLRVDSPGGSALASDLVWREIVECDKPIVASMGDTAASGGYYISMGADKIFAEPGTLTGSIGVVGGKLAVKGLLDKVGVTTETIRRGKNSGVFSSSEPFSTSEREAWKRLMTDIYKQFTSKAAQGRKMDVSKLEGLAQGRLFTGKMAAANGLVDKVGTLHDAIDEAKKLAKLDADEKVDLLILPEPKSFFEELFGPTAGDAKSQLLTQQTWLPQQIATPLREAQTWLRLFERPVVMMMPFAVEIR